jgi:hypothetical protein
MSDAERLDRALQALRELMWWNGLSNDLDAYLSEVAEWGLGEKETHPNPESFGVSPLGAEFAMKGAAGR